jgi:predicted Zn-dependent protease
MKLHFLLLLFIAGVFASCNNSAPIVEQNFIDSLLNNYQSSSHKKINIADSLFWKNRADSTKGASIALTQYAGKLIQHFHINGDIKSLQKADSIIQQTNKEFKNNDAGILRMLSSIKITKHEFKQAQDYSLQALKIGSEKYASTLIYFDACLELGEYQVASYALHETKSTNQYGYFFRRSKWEHLNGNFDSAVYYMLKAGEWSGGSIFLKQSALSNAADLYFHEGKLKEAYNLYVENLRTNADDYHSLQGIGRIALLHDNNIPLAEKIFNFIQTKNQLPDMLYNFIWLAEQKADTTLQKKYADEFINKASESIYGNMYNKYLIEIYGTVLHDYSKALSIAEKELTNRTTPQTYAWYVWALHLNKQDDKAIAIFNQYVSGKPLEALELFYMAEVMKGVNKNYNAEQFFKAAEKNKYDLSPFKEKELQDFLK